MRRMLLGGVLPGGFGAQVWTFFTYSLIHADLTHLGFNALWLLAFGTPVARRFGACALFRLFHGDGGGGRAGALDGLSRRACDHGRRVGGISGMMGAATRFAFQPGGPLDFWRPRGTDPDRIPAAPLSVALRNPRVLTFLVVWFALNLLFGLGSLSIVGYDQNVAWEAHAGGFIAGLLLFSLFDPVAPQQSGTRDEYSQFRLSCPSG